jgi:hypothetical protein
MNSDFGEHYPVQYLMTDNTVCNCNFSHNLLFTYPEIRGSRPGKAVPLASGGHERSGRRGTRAHSSLVGTWSLPNPPTIGRRAHSGGRAHLSARDLSLVSFHRGLPLQDRTEKKGDVAIVASGIIYSNWTVRRSSSWTALQTCKSC